MQVNVISGNNLPLLKQMKSQSFSLIYIDPPFNTGKRQRLHDNSYEDSFATSADYIKWLRRRIRQAHRLLDQRGSIFVHCDSREAHYIKIMLDEVFGRVNFRNEIIWAYDYGGRSKKIWSRKHDTIFWYSKTSDFKYNYNAIDRIPYMLSLIHI